VSGASPEASNGVGSLPQDKRSPTH
jgi:hypothetical protein